MATAVASNPQPLALRENGAQSTPNPLYAGRRAEVVPGEEFAEGAGEDDDDASSISSINEADMLEQKKDLEAMRTHDGIQTVPARVQEIWNEFGVRSAFWVLWKDPKDKAALGDIEDANRRIRRDDKVEHGQTKTDHLIPVTNILAHFNQAMILYHDGDMAALQGCLKPFMASMKMKGIPIEEYLEGMIRETATSMNEKNAAETDLLIQQVCGSEKRSEVESSKELRKLYSKAGRQLQLMYEDPSKKEACFNEIVELNNRCSDEPKERLVPVELLRKQLEKALPMLRSRGEQRIKALMPLAKKLDAGHFPIIRWLPADMMETRNAVDLAEVRRVAFGERETDNTPMGGTSEPVADQAMVPTKTENIPMAGTSDPVVDRGVVPTGTENTEMSETRDVETDQPNTLSQEQNQVGGTSEEIQLDSCFSPLDIINEMDGSTMYGKVVHVIKWGVRGARVIVNRGTDNEPYINVYPGSYFAKAAVEAWQDNPSLTSTTCPSTTIPTSVGRVADMATGSNYRYFWVFGGRQVKKDGKTVTIVTKENWFTSTAGLVKVLRKPKTDEYIERVTASRQELLCKFEAYKERNIHPGTKKKLTEIEKAEMPWFCSSNHIPAVPLAKPRNKQQQKKFRTRPSDDSEDSDSSSSDDDEAAKKKKKTKGKKKAVKPKNRRGKSNSTHQESSESEDSDDSSEDEDTSKKRRLKGRKVATKTSKGKSKKAQLQEVESDEAGTESLSDEETAKYQKIKATKKSSKATKESSKGKSKKSKPQDIESDHAEEKSPSKGKSKKAKSQDVESDHAEAKSSSKGKSKKAKSQDVESDHAEEQSSSDNTKPAKKSK